MSDQASGKVPVGTVLSPDTRLMLQRHGHRVPDYVGRDEADYLRMTAERLGIDEQGPGGPTFNRRLLRWAVAGVLVLGALRLLFGFVALMATQH